MARVQAARAGHQAGEAATAVDLALHTLHKQLDRVERRATTRWEWDTPEGEAFLRNVKTLRDAGVDMETLGDLLGIDGLKYVIEAREGYL